MPVRRQTQKSAKRTALNPAQKRGFARTPGRSAGVEDSAASAPRPGPRTNWAEAEAKFQKGNRRTAGTRKRQSASETEVRSRMIKGNRRRSAGRTLAKPGLKARASRHQGVSQRHQTGTT